MGGDKLSPGGASIAEQPGHCLVPDRRRDVQRRPPILLGGRDVGAHANEQSGHRLVSLPHREIQRRPPVLIGGCNVGAFANE